MWIVTGKASKSLIASCVCVWAWMGGQQGPPRAVPMALLQTLYLSCANIAKVMSPNTIYLHADVCMDVGPETPTYIPECFTGILFSSQRRNAVIVPYGWATKESRTQTTAGGPGFTGPRGAEIAGARVTHRFPTSIIISQHGFIDDIPQSLNVIWS